MPRVEIDTMPDEARVWVFAAQDALTAQGEQALTEATDAFLHDWRAHGAPLVVGRALRDGRFLCVAVDQRTEGASGCSIDGLFRSLRSLEPALGTSMLSSGTVYWRDAAGTVSCGSRADFAALADAGTVSADTPVFDVTIDTLGGWRSRFECPAAESWHNKYFAKRSKSTTS